MGILWYLTSIYNYTYIAVFIVLVRSFILLYDGSHIYDHYLLYAVQRYLERRAPLAIKMSSSTDRWSLATG